MMKKMLLPLGFFFFIFSISAVSAQYQQEVFEQACENFDENTFHPICGRSEDGFAKTYYSFCSLVKAGAEFLHEGRCTHTSECINAPAVSVCGRAGKYGYKRNYGSLCEMRADGAYLVQYGTCEIDFGCRSDYWNPVCGLTPYGGYVTYNNMCLLEKDRAEYLGRGECEFESACAKNNDPVCGLDFVSRERKTFRNRCELEKSYFTFFHEGECHDTAAIMNVWKYIYKPRESFWEAEIR